MGRCRSVGRRLRIAGVSTELTRRRAVDLLRVATALCPAAPDTDARRPALVRSTPSCSSPSLRVRHCRPPLVDPRGPRFGAAVTTVVLAVALLTGAAWLLAAQAVVFALGAAGRSPYAVLLPPRRPAAARPTGRARGRAPPRFAQAVGLAFALLGLVGCAAGTGAVGARRDRARARRPPSSTRRSASAWAARSTCWRVAPRPAPSSARSRTTARPLPHGGLQHEPQRRPGRRRLGRGPPRRPEDRHRRGRRGHLRVRQEPHHAAPSGIDWKKDLQDPVRRDFVDQEGFETLLSEGIANDDTVVLYGGNNNWFAAYAYWYFKLYGHDGREAARRRPQEVGARLPRAGRRSGPERARHDVQGQGAGHARSAPSATRSSAAIGSAEPGRRPLARRVRRQAARPGAPAAGAVAAPRPHPDRPQHPVVEDRQRRRHLQVATTS